MIDFSQYAPQKIFLIQGDEAVFDDIVATASATDPMMQALSVPRFTIEHAHDVVSFASEGTGQERTFVVSFSAFSPEAAQVLLKSLEEPAPLTTLIFITRYPYLVPQTVRSRVMLVSQTGQEKSIGVTRDILQAIKKEAGEKDDEAAVRRARALRLLDELERSVRKDPANVSVVYDAKRMLFHANLPTKYVLDYVATVTR